MPRLTKKLVEGVEPRASETVLWDTEIPGFGMRVHPSGRRVYILKYRNKHGRQRKPTIGQHGVITADQARKMARLWLAEVAKGNDPAEDAKVARNAPTLEEFAAEYMDRHARPKKRPLSALGDERNLQNHILPKLGRICLIDLSRGDISKFHHSMREKPGAANRCLALLSKMFNLAEKWGFRPDGSSPCRHVEKYPERKLERFLSSQELAKLGDALNRSDARGEELPSVYPAIRLLIFTGCRLSEILTLRWADVDIDNSRLNLAETKTGPRVVYLAPPALKVLAEISRTDDNPFVIVGAKPSAHLINLQKPWRRIRAAAGLQDVRIHDLRHSYASVGAAAGLSIPIIGKLLGHTQGATTERYAHLADDPMRVAAEVVQGRIAASLSSPLNPTGPSKLSETEQQTA